MKALRRLPWLSLAGLLVCSTAHANGLGMYDFGSRSAGLGGAVTADTQDFSANYYNPAGLVRAERVRVDLGYMYAVHNLQSNGRDNQVDPAHGLSAGIVAPGKIFGLPFAFGFALHLPDDRISRARALPQYQPRWELYDNRVQLIAISANIAIAPWKWLRIGGGLSFISSTRGRLEIMGIIRYPDADNSMLTHTVDADLAAVRYPQVGVQVDPLPWLTIGVTYRGSFNIKLELDAIVSGQIHVGPIRNPVVIPGSYALSSKSVSVTLPQQVVLGVAVRPLSSLTVLADLTWIDWSQYINPTAQLDVALNLNIPPNLMGFNPPAVPPTTAVVPASFAFTFVPRVAVEWRRALGVHEVALRGGYRYDPTPIPSQPGVTNFYDSDRHVVSFGTGFRLGGLAPVLKGGLSIDVHGQLQLLPPRTIRKDSPIDPVGDAVVGGNVFSLGTTLGVLF